MVSVPQTPAHGAVARSPSQVIKATIDIRQKKVGSLSPQIVRVQFRNEQSDLGCCSIMVCAIGIPLNICFHKSCFN